MAGENPFSNPSYGLEPGDESAPNPFADSDYGKEAELGIKGTLWQGAKSAARALDSAGRTYTGNGDAVVDNAKAQQEAPKDYRLENFYADVQRNKEDDAEDAGLWDGIKNVGGAIADNPAGAGLAIVEQLPNAVPTLAGGFAGFKAGALAGGALGTAVPVVGNVAGAAVGGVIGGLAGMFIGNTAIETGHKAMAAADDGQFTPDEMGQVQREGAIKGGVITAIDGLTLGLGGKVASAMQRTVTTAMETATRKVLVDRGIDVADEAAVLAARQSPEISAAVRAAQDGAIKVTDTLKRRATEAGTLLGMESVGEGLGEYLGELAATGEADVTDAVMEAALSLGQSGAEAAWNISRNRADRGQWEPAKIQPMPTADNPNPAPIDRPDPNAGSLSRAANLLPAPDAKGDVFVDGSGNASTNRPAWVNPDNDPNAQSFGPGMDQQAARGEPALQGDYMARPRFAEKPGLGAGAVEVADAAFPALTDQRERVFFTDEQGNTAQGRSPNVPPRDYVQGGRGMDQQAPAGKTYSNVMAAKNAISKAPQPGALEVVKVGPKQFEVRTTTEAQEQTKPVLQNRDRSTPASVTQMRGIAAKPDYQRVSISRDFANGAPVVEPGASVPASRKGRSEVVSTASGRKINAQYAVIEAADLLPSHDINGSQNADYENGAPGKSRAIAGNGRVTGISHAYTQGTAGEYRRELEADAGGHGISPAAIKGMKNPVLVRIMPQDQITQDIGDESNTATVSALSGAEQARNDAKRIDAGSMAFDDNGEISEATVRQFIQAMPEAERSALLDGGRPSRQAFERAASAVFASAYESDELVRLQAQATDPEARTVLAGLLAAASKMARLKGQGQWDIRGLVVEAAQAAVNATRNGQTLAAYAQQLDIERNPEATYFIDLFAANSRSGKRIGEELSAIADTFYAEASKAEADMFGAVPRRNRQELLGESNGAAEGQPGSAQPTGQPAGPAAIEASGPAAAANDSEQAGAGADAQAETFQLNQQTEEELAAADAANKARIKAEEKAQAEADEKQRKADEQAQIKAQSEAQADNFTLGANAEDSLSGQGGMFDSQPSLTELGGKPASKPAAQVDATSNATQPAQPATPVKWFGSQNKADAYLKGNKMQATHEVVAVSASRFEIREKAKSEPVAPAAKPATAAPEKPAASSNTIFTGEAADEARAFIKSMLNGSQLNSGVDPRLFQAGITLAGYHIEKGARSFAAFAKAMLADMGDGVRPYLKQWYMGVKYDPRASSLEGMSSAAMVDAFNLADIATEAASPAPAPTPATEQAQSLVDSFYALIRNDRMPKDNRELRKLVTEFDGKEADNARLKEAQEDLEAAIARYARDIAKRNMSDQATFSHLLGLYQQQPNLNVRTSSSIENQAYSTPAPLAYLAARLADIDRSSSVYEPTAGNGMLLMTADPKKATANELDEQRYNNLRALGFDAMQGDAMQVIESGALAAKSQDAIITNPPFGSVKDSAGNPVKISVDGYKIGQIDHLIAAEALKAMKDKGKATLILGANKVPGGVSTDDRIFFNWLYSHYNVTGHFELAGDLYNRQGAGWPVRVITINGRSSSANISPKQGVTQRVNTWEEVYEQYEQVLGAQLAKPAVAAGGGKSNAPTDDAATAPQPDAGKTETPDSASRPGTRAGGAGNVSGTAAGNSGNSSNSQPGTLGGSDTVQRPDAAAPKPDQLEPEASAGRPDDGRRAAEGTKSGKPAGSPVSTGENAFQAKYVPRASRKDEGVLIPVNMAQPMQDALSSLEDAVGDIDRFVMDELGYASQDELNDGLMGLQVDSVAAAIYQMKQGKGIVIADQTGIGKGRQAAAIIRWAERSGKTPVFVTMKDTLFSDMHGDLLDIGSDNITPLLMNIDSFVKTEAGGKLFANQANKHRKVLDTVAATGELPKGNNALFLTYSQINKPNTQRRVLTALAPNAIFILDESHNAGGESATGEFMRELLIDAAGVTYLSATYAKRPDNMPLYFKTDIGAAISDSGNLMDAMAQGGLPLQTVVSNNLVKAGQMFRRERSYDGVSIETEVDTANRATHEAMSDAATSALRAIVKADKAFHEGYVKALKDELEAEGGALDDVAGNQASESVDHTEFSSVVHNFIRQMLLGIKADTAADRAIEALKRGEKPLIALENTMGSFLNEYAETNGIKTGDSLGEFDYRTVLSRALERSRAVKKKDAMGNEEIVQIPLGELDFITRAAYDDAQQIIDGLKIDIPVSPLDWIRHRIEQAGYSVAEITGRNRTVDYSKARPVLSTLPSAEQTDKVGTTQRFNNGTLDAIILNVSGSTGISLHASEKFKDQRKRLMIVAQPAQDINVFMQMLGRVHRTGQVQVPAYLILNADLPAEKRPTALLNGKMQSLNANTSSNTESATSIKSQDMLNKYGDQVIGAYLQDNLELAIALGINPGSEGDAPDGLARKVTGRMALMPVADQQTFYAEIEEQYSSLIEYLNDSNQNELLPRTFDFEAEIIKEATLVEATDEKTPFGQEAVYGEYKIKAQGKQMTPAEIRAEMDKNLGGVDGAAHAKALIANLKQQWADTINQERRENGLGDTFDRAKYHAWLNKRVTDPAYAQTLVDQAQQSYDAGIPVAQLTPESMSTQPDQLRLITEHRIGSTWRIDINGDLYNAVVVNVRSSHKKSGNPFSASKLQIQLAVNGPLRTITVPGSQWSKIEVAPLYGLSIDNAFRDQVEGSQTAKIVTGNLLAAYGEIKDAKGTIISFTKKDGSIEQGILLPKKFDFKQNTRGDFQFRSAKDAMTFLERSNDPMTARFGIASRDAAVRVRPAHGGIVVIVPKSKARGGKYFLDKNLLSITGDFVSDGNFMQALVRGPNQAKAIEWLMRKAPLYAMPSQADDARSVLGLPPAQAMPSQEQTKPRYRLTDTNTKGIPLFSARAIAKKVMAATGLNATVVNTEADLPADLQAQIKRDKATGRAAGIYHNGTAYLVASNLRDTQHAISVALHEAIGHGGVQSVLGDKLGAVMREIYRDMPKAMRAELERRYAGQMAGMSEAEAQSMIAEEYVAHLAETDPQHSVINRLVALLRKFIRATFGDAAALKWSRNDLVQLLAEARAAVRNNDGGPKGSSRYRETDAAMALAALPDVSEADESAFVASLKGDAATRSFANAMYQARGTESPFFKGWFGKSRMVDKQGQPIAFVHRSYGERDTFADADLGKNTGTPTAALGHFLARKDVGNVERYGPVVEQFYIRMTKPKVVTQAQFEAMGDWSLTQVQAYRKTLMEQGHDGLYIQGLAWPVVFEGKNIKARRNSGTFDETASTRYSLAQTATAAFKRWFGDSKVVDAEGKPLVVYHGTKTDTDFSEFNTPAHFGTAGQANDIAGSLRFFAPEAARGNSNRVMPVYLSIENPAKIIDDGSGHGPREYLEATRNEDILSYSAYESVLLDENGDTRSDDDMMGALIAAMEERGYDGFVYENTVEGAGDSWVAFRPDQIKSAIGNNGEFDGGNSDIRYSLTGARDLFDRAAGPTPLDNNDPFAEENRRLREGDKTLWQKAKKVFARQFAPGGLLPEAVFNEKITRDSEFQAVEFDVRHLSGGLNKAVNADYGVDVDNLTAEQMKPLAEALTGKVDPAIPEATRVAIVAMRQYIDSLSGEYLDIIQGQIDALQEKAATYGPALKAANDARKALNAAIASDSDPAIMQALAGKKAALAAQVKAKKAMDGLKGEERAQAKAAYEVAVKAHDQAKAVLRASLSPELKAQAKAAEALRAEANAARSSSAEAKAESALHDKISANLGAYVNRSYQAFDDPNWFKTVPTEVVNAARTYLANGYMEQGETAAEARRLADVTVNEMLKNGTAYDSMGAFIAEGKLGAKDLTVLIKRKEIAPEIRALLGEYMDPRLNFAKSATKMGRLVWNQRFLDRVLDFGMGTLFFEGKNRPADATTQIAGDQSETYAPLNGLWTFPEVAQAFQDALGKEQMSDLYRTVVRLNGMVKYGKTILSPTTAMRNWQSAMFFSLANGHFDLTQMKKSWAAMREQVTQNATGEDLAYLRKLKQLGVVYDTPYAGEMMALLQDARMDELLSSKSGTGLKWLRKANQFAQGFYSFGDDFWKIIGYENEKASLIGAGIPEGEAEVMAAKRIRDTYPTYSMIGKAVQWLRRFPLAGTFVSFPSEIIRTSVNMFQLVQVDLKSDNPKIRALGRKRALGMAMVSGGFYALAALSAAAAGVGDDEEEALRDLAAPWSKNSTFLYTGRDADGKLRYFDLSFLDPYGYWKRPLTAMMRDQPWEKAAVSGLSDLLSPFFGADITAGAIFEVLANKKPTGGAVFNPDAGSVDQLQDIANHMRKALQPGFVSNGERLWLAGSEARREGSGQPYVMRDELVSLLGWRASTLDTQTGLYYRSFDFTDGLTNAKKTLTRTLRSSNEVSVGDIQEAKASANAQYQQAFVEMGRLVRSAEAAGMSRTEIMQTLKLSGVGQRNIFALMSGRVPPIDIGMQAQNNAVRQAVVMRDREHGAEIARRFRLAREE